MMSENYWKSWFDEASTMELDKPSVSTMLGHDRKSKTHPGFPDTEFVEAKEFAALTKKMFETQLGYAHAGIDNVKPGTVFAQRGETFQLIYAWPYELRKPNMFTKFDSVHRTSEPNTQVVEIRGRADSSEPYERRIGAFTHATSAGGRGGYSHSIPVYGFARHDLNENSYRNAKSRMKALVGLARGRKIGPEFVKMKDEY